MRHRLTIALLLFAGTAHAQGYVGGIVIDSATNAPMPCVQVSLLDTAGRTVARQLTMPDGVFQMEAPARGTYQLRFFIWAHEPLLAEPEEIDPAVDRARKYSLGFRLDRNAEVWRTSRTAANVPPGRPVNGRAVQVSYPETLRSRGVEGEVVAQFVVDSTGYVRPSSVKITHATHYEFGTAVRSFLNKAQFEPATLDHIPVCALVRDIPFTFTLLHGEWDLLMPAR